MRQSLLLALLLRKTATLTHALDLVSLCGINREEGARDHVTKVDVREAGAALPTLQLTHL